MAIKLRLSYFCRVLVHAPDILLSVTLQEFEVAEGRPSFLGCVINDMSWLRLNLELFAAWPCPFESRDVRFNNIRRDPHTFRFSLKKALLAFNSGRLDLETTSDVGNVLVPIVVPLVEPTVFECHECSRRFKSKTQLDGHMSSKHKNRNYVRKLADTIYCMACLRQYHTRHKMIVHLAYNALGVDTGIV